MIDKNKIVKILQGQYDTLRKLSLTGDELEVKINLILDRCDKYDIDYLQITLGSEAYQRAKELGQI